MKKTSAAKSTVSRHTLKNGLTVLLKEMHAAPVTSLCVWYRVGSRNEHLGITGISHWVEHMMFKGTRKYDEQEMDRLVSREGGARNAFTSIDFTCYYETMPADRIDLVIDIESDRMMNTRFEPREVESERTVIINERQMYENNPGFRLAEEVTAAAFRVHPYGHEVIGHEADLRRMTREDLHQHYRKYYAPNNAVLTVAGAFDNKEMLTQLNAKFGKHKRGAPIAPVRADEPPQKGERRVMVRGEGATDYLSLSFRAPSTTRTPEDYFALVALDSVLCGASGLSFFGGGTSNRSSRLSQSMVDEGFAADVSGGVVPTIDPNLYSISATIMPGKKINEVEQRLWAQLEHFKQNGVTQDELNKAVKQTRAQFAFTSETATNQAFWMGFCSMFADHSWFDGYLPRLSAVSRDDVKRVANQYLSRDTVTVGHYLGNGNA